MADIKKIVKHLLTKYPDPKIELRFNNPLELLVATILSAQCTDIKVNEVTKDLFKKYRTAAHYAGAETATLEKEIRPTGFYKNKTKMIIQCCDQIVRDFSGKVPDTLEELTSLAGIGRKTANVILGSAFGKQTMGVDTHVLRVSNRLGIAHSKNPDKVEEELVKQFPKNRLTSINLALVLHGRRTCKAKKPLCPGCVLYRECEWPDKVAA
ncbi:MAG: endonuclease III [Nitrospiraceae bacterium]|nr:MAG: endonuclease III [Nitrospiraceae bacterium]